MFAASGVSPFPTYKGKEVTLAILFENDYAGTETQISLGLKMAFFCLQLCGLEQDSGSFINSTLKKTDAMLRAVCGGGEEGKSIRC